MSGLEIIGAITVSWWIIKLLVPGL